MTWQNYRKRARFVITGKPGAFRWKYVSGQGVVLAKGARKYQVKAQIYSLLATLKQNASKFEIVEE